MNEQPPPEFNPTRQPGILSFLGERLDAGGSREWVFTVEWPDGRAQVILSEIKIFDLAGRALRQTTTHGWAHDNGMLAYRVTA